MNLLARLIESWRPAPAINGTSGSRAPAEAPWRHRSAWPIAATLMLPWVAGLCGAQTPTMDRFTPATLRSGVATKLAVTGTNLDSVRTFAILAGTALLQSGNVTSATSTLVTLPPLTLPTGNYGVLLLGGLSPPAPISYAEIDALPAPPVVSGAAPALVTNDADTVITITGNNLGETTSVYLERDNTIVRCVLSATGSQTSIQATVPRGATPGAYRVRALVDDAAAFYTGSPVTVTIQAAANAPIPITNVSQPFGVNVGPTQVVLTVPGLSAFPGLQVQLDNPDDLLGPVAAVVQTTSGDQALITIPAAIPPKLYDFLAVYPGRTTVPSEAKILMLDPATLIDYLGNTTVLGVDNRTVAFVTPTWISVVEAGELRYVYNLPTGRALVSDTNSQQNQRFGLGMLHDSGLAAIAGGLASLQSIVPNTTVGGVDFQFRYQHSAGAPFSTFTSTWGIEAGGGALTQSWAFARASGAPNAYNARLTSIGIPRGFRHLVAAQSGLALDANFLAGVRRTFPTTQAGMSFYQNSYDMPVCFFEDPQGGGMLVEATGVSASVDVVLDHWPASVVGSTEWSLSATCRNTGLATDNWGPVRYVPTSSGWTNAVEALESAMTNPHIPSWFSTLNHVTTLLALSGTPASTITTAEIVQPFHDVQDQRSLLFTDYRTVYVHNPMTETPNLLPRWTPSTAFTAVCTDLQTAWNFKVVPYLATPGLGASFTPQLPYRQSVLQRWDFQSQSLKDQFWDLNENGVFDPLGGDYWPINLSLQSFRNVWVSEVRNGRMNSLPFNGVYCDFLDGNLPRSDRNPINGDAPTGFTNLCTELRQAFNGASNDFIIASEGQNDVLVRGGASLGAIYVNDVSSIGKDPFAAYEILAAAHPMGSYLLRRNAKAFATFNVPEVGNRQAGKILSQFSGYAHDCLPTMTIHSGAEMRPKAKDPANVRSMTQSVEEGLFRRLQNVRMKTDPDPLWSLPDIVAVYELGPGVAMPITQSWVVQKLICDLFWWFGGRAPTSAELSALAARTSFNAISMYAAMTEVREIFRVSPVVPTSRTTFRTLVQTVFPLYPLI